MRIRRRVEQARAVFDQSLACGLGEDGLGVEKLGERRNGIFLLAAALLRSNVGEGDLIGGERFKASVIGLRRTRVIFSCHHGVQSASTAKMGTSTRNLPPRLTNS